MIDVNRHDRWGVKGSGNEKFSIVTDTQKEAIEVARKIARNKKAEVVVYGKDGRVRHRDSYVDKK